MQIISCADPVLYQYIYYSNVRTALQIVAMG